MNNVIVLRSVDRLEKLKNWGYILLKYLHFCSISFLKQRISMFYLVSFLLFPLLFFFFLLNLWANLFQPFIIILYVKTESNWRTGLSNMKTNLTECIGPGVMIHLPCERGEQSRAWPEQGFCACSFPKMNVIPFPDHKGYFSYWSKAIRNVSNIIYIDTKNNMTKRT